MPVQMGADASDYSAAAMPAGMVRTRGGGSGNDDIVDTTADLYEEMASEMVESHNGWCSSLVYWGVMTVGSLLIAAIIAYQLLLFSRIYAVHSADWQDCRNITAMEGLKASKRGQELYRTAEHVVQHSVLGNAYIEWWQQTRLYKLAMAESYWTMFGMWSLAVLALVLSVRLIFQYAMVRRGISQGHERSVAALARMLATQNTH